MFKKGKLYFHAIRMLKCLRTFDLKYYSDVEPVVQKRSKFMLIHKK